MAGKPLRDPAEIIVDAISASMRHGHHRSTRSDIVLIVHCAHRRDGLNIYVIYVLIIVPRAMHTMCPP
jgi:hypothetical protein